MKSKFVFLSIILALTIVCYFRFNQSKSIQRFVISQMSEIQKSTNSTASTAFKDHVTKSMNDIETSVINKISLADQYLSNMSLELTNVSVIESKSSSLQTFKDEEIKTYINFLNRFFNDDVIVQGLNSNKLNQQVRSRLEQLMVMKTKLESILLFRLADTL